MTTIRTLFTRGRVRVSRVVYIRDVSDPTDSGIPLGVMCDISAGDVYGLSLVARRNVPDDELISVGDFVREQISKPYDTLRLEYDWIWEQKDRRPQAFKEVMARHSASLRFLPFTESLIIVPHILKVQPENIDNLGVWARDELCARRNKEYWELMSPPAPVVIRPNFHLAKRGAVVKTEPPMRMAA
jgi:hypothetical protein